MMAIFGPALCLLLAFRDLGEGECFFVVVLVDCRGLPLLLCTLAMAADSNGFGVFFYYIGKCSNTQQWLSLGKGFLTQFCNTGRDFGEFLDGN